MKGNYNYSSTNNLNNIDFNAIFDSFKERKNTANEENNFSDMNSFGNENGNFSDINGSRNENTNFSDIKGSRNENTNFSDTNSSNPFGNIDINTIMKVKSIMDTMNNSKNDPRSNLLRSLKPYLKSNKREQVDKYIQIFSISKAFEGMNNIGGDNKNDV